MWLIIDDERELSCEVIARTAEAGRKMLEVGGWEAVVFDHDLGCEETGYDLLTYALDASLMPPIVQLCTANPVGRQRMRSALEAHGYVTKDGGTFIK